MTWPLLWPQYDLKMCTDDSLKYSAFLQLLGFHGQKDFIYHTVIWMIWRRQLSYGKYETNRLYFGGFTVVSSQHVWTDIFVPKMHTFLHSFLFFCKCAAAGLQSTPSALPDPHLPRSLAGESTQPSFHALVIPPGLLQHPSWLRSRSTL